MDDSTLNRHAKWLMESGFGLELRAAAASRSFGLRTEQSVPYDDPNQPTVLREADLVIDLGWNPQIADVPSVTVVAECKTPKSKTWAALLRATELPLSGFLEKMSVNAPPSLPTDDRHNLLEHEVRRLIPFRGRVADSLVTLHANQDQNAAGNALRQSMSAAIGINRIVSKSSLHLTLPVLITAGELVSAGLNSSGDEVEVREISNIFLRASHPSLPERDKFVHVMTAAYFEEQYLSGLVATERLIQKFRNF